MKVYLIEALRVRCVFAFSLQHTETVISGRGRQGQEAGLSVAHDDLWVRLPEEEKCVVQVVMSAKRLEEGLGLPAGQLPESLVNGKDLVLVVVSAAASRACFRHLWC